MLDTRRFKAVECNDIPKKLPLQKSITKEELLDFLKSVEIISQTDITLGLLSNYSTSFWSLKYIYIVKYEDSFLVFDRYWKNLYKEGS